MENRCKSDFMPCDFKFKGGVAGFFSGILLICFFAFPLVIRAAAVENLKVDKSTAAQVAAAVPAPKPAQAAQAPAPTVNPITLAAVKAGVLACTSRINQVMTYLTAGSQSGAYLFMPKAQPDQSIFSASLEVASHAGTPIYVSASFAPLANGQSGAVYDAVEYVAQTCDFVEKNVFKDLKRAGILKRDIIMLDGVAIRVFLMPAGTGCVVIKKEVVQ